MENTGKEESWYKKQVRLRKAPSFPEGDCNGNHPGKTLGMKSNTAKSQSETAEPGGL